MGVNDLREYATVYFEPQSEVSGAVLSHPCQSDASVTDLPYRKAWIVLDIFSSPEPKAHKVSL